MNTKMKVLSLALIGAFGYVGAASAACPSSAVPPWSSKSDVGGSLAISSPGYDGTECKLDAALTSAAFGSAFVRDDSPDSEERYRARFFVNTDALAGLNVAQSVRVFSANAETPHSDVSEVVRVSVFGNVAGTQQSLAVVAGCDGVAGNVCSTNIPLSGAGPHTVQIEWVKGASGEINVWVDNADEANPDETLTGNTDGWVVDYAVLGLSTPSAGFRANQLNNVVSFDQFDSRRTSFID